MVETGEERINLTGRKGNNVLGARQIRFCQKRLGSQKVYNSRFTKKPERYVFEPGVFYGH